MTAHMVPVLKEDSTCTRWKFDGASVRRSFGGKLAWGGKKVVAIGSKHGRGKVITQKAEFTGLPREGAHSAGIGGGGLGEEGRKKTKH